MIDYINKHLLTIAIWTVIISVLWVAFGPLIITQFSIVDFSAGQNNTGIIGDTIGGITAPIVGLTSVILLFLALIKQIEANHISVHEANFRIIYNEINELKNSADNYSYQVEKGRAGISNFAIHYGTKHTASELTDLDYEDLSNFDHTFLNKFGKIIYLLDNLKTSPEYKNIVSMETYNIFNSYFGGCFSAMNSMWTVTAEGAVENGVERKMYFMKEQLTGILENLIKRNNLSARTDLR